MRANSGGILVPEVHLFHSRDRFAKYIRKHFGEAVDLGSEGQMTYQDGVAVVLMGYDGDTFSELSLLAHESYHAAIAHMAWLREDDAGEETMAYLIQTIADGLFRAHAEWKARKKG